MVGDAASVAADAAATAAAVDACGAVLGGRGGGFVGRGGSSGGRSLMGGRLGAPSASPPPPGARLTRSPSGEEMGASEREMPPLFSNGTPGVPDLPLGVGGLCDQGPYSVAGLLNGVGVVGDGVGVGVGGRGSVGLSDVEMDAVFSGRMGGVVGGVSMPPPSSVGVGGVAAGSYTAIGAGLGGDATGVHAAMDDDPGGGTSIESDAVGCAGEDGGLGDVPADVPDVTPVERVVRLGDGSFVY